MTRAYNNRNVVHMKIKIRKNSPNDVNDVNNINLGRLCLCRPNYEMKSTVSFHSRNRDTDYSHKGTALFYANMSTVRTSDGNKVRIIRTMSSTEIVCLDDKYFFGLNIRSLQDRSLENLSSWISKILQAFKMTLIRSVYSLSRLIATWLVLKNTHRGRRFSLMPTWKIWRLPKFDRRHLI